MELVIVIGKYLELNAAHFLSHYMYLDYSGCFNSQASNDPFNENQFFNLKHKIMGQHPGHWLLYWEMLIMITNFKVYWWYRHQLTFP